MNLETDTWDIINAYFRDTPNYLVRHHIDSYNDFVQNKIPQIFQNLSKMPPFILIDNDNITTYEIKVYYGGKDSNKYTFTNISHIKNDLIINKVTVVTGHINFSEAQLVDMFEVVDTSLSNVNKVFSLKVKWIVKNEVLK